MKKIGWILIIVGLLAGCGQEVAQTQEPPTAALPSQLPLPSQTPFQTSTLTFTSTPTLSNKPTFTSTPTYTSTPTPTNTPSPPLVDVQSINFPAWVSDPETNVLLIISRNDDYEYENLALFNASTGEHFDLPYMNSRAYFWTPDGQNIGLLSQDNKEIKLINIQTGVITLHEVDKEATVFGGSSRESDPPTGSVVSGDIESEDFLLDHWWENLSIDGRYSGGYGAIYDYKTDQHIELGDPTNGLYVIESKWSPVAALLGVSYSNKDIGPTSTYTFEGILTVRLDVIDLESGVVINSYKDITFPNWSPDGTQFLYQLVTEDEFHGEGWYSINSPPCIFDKATETSKCFPMVINDHPIENDYYIYYYRHDWSPDQRIVSYAYFIHEYNPSGEKWEDDFEYGGVCMITLEDDLTRCILGDFDDPIKRVVRYQWSPDSKYMSFMYANNGPYNHEWFGSPKIGIVDVETGEYFTIGDGFNTFNCVWKPMNLIP